MTLINPFFKSDLSMERGDGFQGPIIISDPENDDEKQLEKMYDGDEVVFLQDWYHLDGPTRRTGEFILSISLYKYCLLPLI